MHNNNFCNAAMQQKHRAFVENQGNPPFISANQPFPL
jgi:hypothetical protein